MKNRYVEFLILIAESGFNSLAAASAGTPNPASVIGSRIADRFRGVLLLEDFNQSLLKHVQLQPPGYRTVPR